MFGFFRRTKRPQPDGRTARTAIRVDATGTANGIAREYAILEDLLGREGRDWVKHDRLVKRLDTGRMIETFIVTHRGTRREVHFDVSGWFGTPSTAEAEAVVERVMARVGAERLVITMPASVAATLAMVLIGLSRNPTNAAVDVPRVVAAMNAASEVSSSKPAQAGDPTSIDLDVATWIALLAAIRSVHSTDLGVQEDMEDLKAFIEGGLKGRRG